MLRREADQIADGVLRRLRPLLVEFIGAAISEPESIGDEESYIADRAARQIARHSARLRNQGQGQRSAVSSPRRKTQ